MAVVNMDSARRSGCWWDSSDDEVVEQVLFTLSGPGGPLSSTFYQDQTIAIARRVLRAVGYGELVDRVEVAEAVCHSISTVPMVQEDEEDGPNDFLVVHPGPARLWAEKYGDRK